MLETGELINMINNGGISAADFFTMHPFSAAENKIFNALFQDGLYFEKFYVSSNQTYYRLSEIAYISKNRIKNCVIITGYRGSGKTNFLKYLQYIVEGKTKIPDYASVWKQECKWVNQREYSSKREMMIRKVDKDYRDTLTKIKNRFTDTYLQKDNDYISENLSKDLTACLRGKIDYINFDVGQQATDLDTMPLYLSNLIIEQINKILCQNLDKRIAIQNAISDFYEKTQNYMEICFEGRVGQNICNFFDYLVQLRVRDCTTIASIKPDLKKLLAKYSIAQLLMLLNIFKLGFIILHETNKIKQFFLFDNIDILTSEDNEVLVKTISSFWAFLLQMQAFIDKLRTDTLFPNWVKAYDETVYIFAMRETTAMHISDHLRDRVKSISGHFDISSDVNKAYVTQKKVDFVTNKEILGKITNKLFLKVVHCIEKIALDGHFVENLFPLFNNSYKTSLQCIGTICRENIDLVEEALKFIHSNKKYDRFGGRGIIYRLIFDGFLQWKYLKMIGVTSPTQNESHEYTYSRLILIILLNMQEKISDRFFVNTEESVSIYDLYDMVKPLMTIDDFVQALNGMYSLRNKNFWSHLITFDNLLTFSVDNIRSLLNVYITTGERKKSVLIRATCAGSIYVQFVCVHFEFFACRFSDEQECPPLFLSKNFNIINEGDDIGKYQFEKTLEMVYTSVKKCCNKLKIVNQKLFIPKNSKYLYDRLNKSFLYSNAFHEERIIHQHISYLDAFRMHAIHDVCPQKTVEINKIVIKYIKLYLKLLVVSKHFYSSNSDHLYNELTECIKVIELANYQDNITFINRDYYNNNVIKR